MRRIIASFALLLAACGRPDPRGGQVGIGLASTEQPPRSFVRITGLSGTELGALTDLALDDDAWQALLRVGVVGNDAAPVAGRYVVQNGAIEFHPRFPFNRGQSYLVRFDPTRLPTPRRGAVIETTVSLPAPRLQSSTVVTAIAPSRDMWPENLLRFYIHFSAPMSRAGAIDFVKLLDERGQELTDVFLEVNANLWNTDDTRFTVLFDPGRVKRGILPNLKLGRAIRERGRYTIVVDPAWRDAAGQPLKEAYRRDVRVGLPLEQPLDVGLWKVLPPVAETRDPLTISFPWALDEGLLQRAIGVSTPAGRAMSGTISTEAGETRWVFVPDAPWERGEHQLIVLTLLEDPSGNKVGRAFEMKPGTATTPEMETVRVPFTPRQR